MIRKSDCATQTQTIFETKRDHCEDTLRDTTSDFPL